MKVRTCADRSRKEAAAFDAMGSVDAQLHGRTMRAEADALDLAADLLVGLQGSDWSKIGPMVREGFKRLRGEHERRKAVVAQAKAESEAA